MVSGSDSMNSDPDYLFFFNDTATTEIYTLSLHDALPIYEAAAAQAVIRVGGDDDVCRG